MGRGEKPKLNVHTENSRGEGKDAPSTVQVTEAKRLPTLMANIKLQKQDALGKQPAGKRLVSMLRPQQQH